MRGELQPLWLELLAAQACAQARQDDEPEPEALQAISEGLRYQHELITAEETDVWLEARSLSRDDLNEYCQRRYWREHTPTLPPAADIDYARATPEWRELLRSELLFTGRFDELAQQLAWRVAASVAGEAAPITDSDRLKGQRELFQAQVGSENLPATLRQLGRDEAWLESLVRLEVGFAEMREQVCTPENRARSLAVLRLPLTCLEVELLDLESADAMREAYLCLASDGLSLAALAEQEHYQIERQEVRLEEFPEPLQQQFLGAKQQQVLQLTTEDDRFQLCVVLAKREPSLAEPRIVARIDADLVAAQCENLVAKHVGWLLGPNATA